jgi:hypothetical protein
MAAVRLRAAELSLAEKLRDLHWPFVTLFAVIGVIGYAVLYSAGGGSHEPVGVAARASGSRSASRSWSRWR